MAKLSLNLRCRRVCTRLLFRITRQEKWKLKKLHKLRINKFKGAVKSKSINRSRSINLSTKVTFSKTQPAPSSPSTRRPKWVRISPETRQPGLMKEKTGQSRPCRMNQPKETNQKMNKNKPIPTKEGDLLHPEQAHFKPNQSSKKPPLGVLKRPLISLFK